MKKQLLLLVMMLLPMMAMADDSGTCGANLTYNFIESTHTLTISGSGDMNYYSVYSRDKIPWYSYKNNIFKIIIEEGVTSIGGSAFDYCEYLKTISIPKSLLSIGNGAFYHCDRLSSVDISDLVSWCNINIYKFSNPLRIAHHLFLNGEEIFDLEIPNSITSINDEVFSGCSNFNSITIPNSVTSIGNRSFSGCSSVTSISIPSSVTTIGGNAFSGCSGMKSIDIPSSVTSIEGGAFAGCSSLTSFTIPNNVNSIKEGTFSGCSSLSTLNIPNSVISIGRGAFSDCINLTSFNLPNNLSNIEGSAFSGCISLSSISIPNSVTSIEEFAFQECKGLTSISLPENLIVIKKGAFSGCISLNDIIIPAKTEYIFEEAFYNCMDMKSVKVLSMNPPEAYESTFSNYNIPLYVPEASISNYQTTIPWSKFSSFKSLTGEEVTTKTCSKPTISYNNSQISFGCDTEDVKFISSITNNDIKNYTTSTIQLSATYNVSVYATKSGYENSDVATATLCWIDSDPKTGGISDGIAQIPAKAVLIQSEGGIVKVEGINDRTPVTIYTPDGKQAGSAVCRNGAALVGTSIQSGSTAIVKIGEKSVKVVIK